MTATDKQFRPDWQLFLITLLLLSFGTVMVFDASYPHAIEYHQDAMYWVKKQLLWAVIGMGGLFAAAKIPYWKWQKWAVPGLIVAILMLVAVKFIGHSALGGQRWIGFGPIRIQPSEVAKLALVLFLAKMIADKPNITRNGWGVVGLLAASGISILLVERQPDMGTAMTMLFSCLLVLFAGGCKKRWIAGILAVAVVAGLGVVLYERQKNDFRWRRLTTFVNPDADPLKSGFQITHSTIALGTGGATGLGFGESREKRMGNLPAQRTDFIYAIVGEEFGMIGTCGVLLAFLWLGGRGYHVAQRTKDPFGALLATGITSIVTVQAMLNMAVVTASVPTTGIPLPFISYGGSSLLPTLFGVGILLNISQHPFRRDLRPAARRARGEEVERTKVKGRVDFDRLLERA